MFPPTVLSATLTAVTVVWWITMLHVSRGRSRRVVPPADQVLTHEGVATSLFLPKRFNVLVWNVEKGHERAFATDFERLTTTSLSASTTTTPHLILLQEYLGSSNVKNTLSTTPMCYDIATSFLYKTDDQEQVRTGVATGSIADPLSVFAEITEDVEPVVKTHKATIVTRYPIQDRQVSLLVVNIHGRNRGGLEPFSRQLQRLKQYIESHDGPVFFAGDFNTNSAAKREWLLGYARELKLTTVTFGVDDRTRSKLSREPLDWVFVRGLAVGASSVPRVGGSDHNPMLVTLAVID